METNNTTTTPKAKKSILARPWVQSILAIIIIFGSLGIFIYWQLTNGVVKIDTSYLDAPVITVAPSVPGTLNALYVHEGDRVPANAPIALVGSVTLYTQQAGIIANTPQIVGSYFSPGQAVATVIVDQKMRVQGELDETGGLNRVTVGQRATFTVDAFPGRQYSGVVDEISPDSTAAGVAFSISDNRPVKQFYVYVRYDTTKYPELKTGMSARIWVHVK